MKRLLVFAAAIFFLVFPQRFCAQAQTAAASASGPAQSAPVMHSGYGEKLRIRGVPNLGKINDRLYRGAQPQQTGLQELKKLGITTVVDLRAENAPKSDWEQKTSESLGLHFVHIPVNGWEPPTNEQVAQFLSIFRDKPDEKVFVHCRFGDDRTGVFVATYRMAFDKMPLEQAMKEMYFFHFNGFWHPSMLTFVRDFPARLEGAPALAAFKPKRDGEPTQALVPAKTPR